MTQRDVVKRLRELGEVSANPVFEEAVVEIERLRRGQLTAEGQLTRVVLAAQALIDALIDPDLVDVPEARARLRDVLEQVMK